MCFLGKIEFYIFGHFPNKKKIYFMQKRVFHININFMGLYDTCNRPSIKHQRTSGTNKRSSSSFASAFSSCFVIFFSFYIQKAIIKLFLLYFYDNCTLIDTKTLLFLPLRFYYLHVDIGNLILCSESIDLFSW